MTRSPRTEVERALGDCVRAAARATAAQRGVGWWRDQAVEWIAGPGPDGRVSPAEVPAEVPAEQRSVEPVRQPHGPDRAALLWAPIDTGAGPRSGGLQLTEPVGRADFDAVDLARAAAVASCAAAAIAAAERADRARSDLERYRAAVGSVVHDVRNAANGLFLQSQVLLAQDRPPAETAALRANLAHARDIDRLLGVLWEVDEIGQGTASVHPEVASGDALFAVLERAARDLVADPGRIDTAAPGPLPSVAADLDRMQLVFRTLVADVTGRDRAGVVRLRARAAADAVVLEVAGGTTSLRGDDDALLDFFAAGAAPAGARPDLSVAAHLLRLQGGEVVVRPGDGARGWDVRLPVVPGGAG